jgi:hypothetical protein
MILTEMRPRLPLVAALFAICAVYCPPSRIISCMSATLEFQRLLRLQAKSGRRRAASSSISLGAESNGTEKCG